MSARSINTLKITKALLFVTVTAIAFTYGIGVGKYQLPPYHIIKFIKEPLNKQSRLSPLYLTENRDYSLTTSRLSYFELDQEGDFILKDGLPYRSEDKYRFTRNISSNTTAIIVMDPWVDMPSDFLNQYNGKITRERIVPLVNRALSIGHPVIILTNDTSKVAYSGKIDEDLQLFVENGQASLIFHHDINSRYFASFLRAQKINSLIYIGFSSNMCIIGREAGIIPMLHEGFRIYFIPEASAAIEYKETWQDQTIHKATTKIISQWAAELIEYDEFMNAPQ